MAHPQVLGKKKLFWMSFYANTVLKHDPPKKVTLCDVWQSLRPRMSVCQKGSYLILCSLLTSFSQSSVRWHSIGVHSLSGQRGFRWMQIANPWKYPYPQSHNLTAVNAGRPRFGSVRLRFGGGTVRAVPVFGSGGCSVEKVFLCFSRV